MSDSMSNHQKRKGVIELVNPPDVTLEEPKPPIDFGVLDSMMNKFDARNKEGF